MPGTNRTPHPCDPLARFLSERYGCEAVRMRGGDTNGAYLLRTPSPCAAKWTQDAASARTEALALRALAGTGVAPEPVEYVEPCAFPAQPSAAGQAPGEPASSGALLVTSFCEGENGQALLDAGDGARVYALLGGALARLQRVRPPEGLPETPGVRVPDYVPAPLANRLRAACSPPASGRCLVHGDFGPHNALVRPDGLTLLDFEWAHAGSPAEDAAWLCWFARLHYAPQADSLLAAFASAYTAAGGTLPAPETTQACAAQAVCRILVRAENAPEEVRQEWVRRAEWTLTGCVFLAPEGFTE